MKIYNWTAPRLYGFIANILLVISWIAMLFFLTWSTAVQKPVPIIIFIIAAVAIIGSGIITIALSTAVPAYWEDLETLAELQEEARQARREYETARDTLIKATLQEDYPTGEPSYD
jgi:uncharacterized membrane protein (DUF106 family)